MTKRRMLAACLGVAALVGSSARAADDVAEAAKRFLPYAEATAAKYELKTASGQPLKLEAGGKSLLRWTNPLTESKNHGELFLWTDRGRPAAVLSMYEYSTSTGVAEHYEWISLALGPIQAAGPRNWSPKIAGMELKPVPEAPPPADTPLRRLGQIRDLSADFSADKTSRQGVTRPIRLMNQPLFRYQPGEEEVIDGALFAFVEGTDPDVFLCLEARLLNGKPTWHYGLARVVRLPLAVSYKGTSIWTARLLSVAESHERKEAPYCIFGIR